MDLFAQLTLTLAALLPHPDPAAIPLVNLLGSWDHRHRACAEHALRCAGQRVEGNLAWAQTHHPDLEVRLACQRLLEDLDVLDGEPPWYDASVLGSAAWPYYHAAMDYGVGSGPPEWGAYRVATALYCDALRACLVPRRVRDGILERLRQKEAEWKRTHPIVPENRP